VYEVLEYFPLKAKFKDPVVPAVSIPENREESQRGVVLCPSYTASPALPVEAVVPASTYNSKRYQVFTAMVDEGDVARVTDPLVCKETAPEAPIKPLAAYVSAV